MRWIVIIALLSWPGICRGQESGAFYQAAYAVLKQAMEKKPPHYSQGVMQQLVQKSGLEEKEVRALLLAGLDEMEHHRKKETETWKKLVQLGEQEVAADKVGKFMKKLLRELRPVVEGKGNYLLDNPVKEASSRAHIFADQGYALVWALLEAGLEAGDTSGRGMEFGLLISGHTNLFEINKDPLYIFFDSRDETFVMEEVREMQRFIIPRLVTKMPESPSFKWVVRKRHSNVLVQPDYRLVLGVDGLNFTGTNLDLRPCMEATVELIEASSDRVVLHKSFKHCTERYGSGSTHTLHEFYGEMTEVIYELVDGYFAQRR